MNEYANGYIERYHDDTFKGHLTIAGIDISPIEGVYFKRDGSMYLWLKRSRMLVYDENTKTYKRKEREPRWEAYLKKQMDGDVVQFRGTFTFMRFMFSIVGVWDKVLGMEKNRLNLFVERLPMNEQTIINGINERKNG